MGQIKKISGIEIPPQNTDTILKGTTGLLLDQQQILDIDVDYYYDYFLGQIIKPNFSGELRKVKLMLHKIRTPGNFTVELRNVTEVGKPGDTVLATVSRPSSEIPTEFAEVEFTFGSPYSVVAGVKYAIVSYGAGYVPDVDNYKYSTTYGLDSYPEALFKKPLVGNWGSDLGEDMYFKTYVYVTESDLINDGTLKRDLVVLDGKKIDGRDVSEDGVKLDNHETLKHTQDTDTQLKSGVVTVDSNDNVGIGTDSPTEKLDVDGNIKATGNIEIEGELKIKVYAQDNEPTLGADQRLAIWQDTNDSNRIYLIFKRGFTASGIDEQVKIEISQVDKYIVINEQTDSYVLVLTDDSKLIDMNKGSACTLTVPKNSVVAFPIGTTIAIRQKGAGQVTIAPVDGDVTINSADGLKTTNQFAMATLIKIDINTWSAFGSLLT